MASIDFFTEDISFQLPKKNAVRRWLKSVILSEQHSLLHLSYIFCSDNYLLDINIQFLNHSYFTDVITFNNSTLEDIIEGDIFISIDRVSENSISFSSSFHIELFRVMVHGLLHLLGYTDNTETGKTLMRQKEDFYLSQVNF